MTTLQSKVAWITGAGTGIGLAAAQALAAGGATVVMSGRRADVLEREADAIKQAGGKAEVEALDVSNAASVKRVTDAILRTPRQDRHPGQQRRPEQPAALLARPDRRELGPGGPHQPRWHVLLHACGPACHAQPQGRRGDQHLFLGGCIHVRDGRRRLQRQQGRSDLADRNHQHGRVHQQHPRLRDLPGGSGDADHGSAPDPAFARGSQAHAAAGRPRQRRSAGSPSSPSTFASTRSSSARRGTGSMSAARTSPSAERCASSLAR